MSTILPFDTRDNFTKFHNYTLDYIMPSLPPNAWKVLCFIIRKTKGWGKDTEHLSYSLIRQGTGIKSDETMRAALKELIDREYVIVGTGGQWDANSYSLNTEYKAPTTEIVAGSTTEIVAGSTTEIVAGSTTEIVAGSTTEIVENKRKEKKEEKHVAAQRTSAEPQSSPFKAILTAFVKWKEERQPGCIINYPAETKAAKEIAKQGWTPEQVIQCCNILMQDAFYQSNSLSLWTVGKQIGAKVRRTTNPSPAAAPPAQDFILDFGSIFGDTYANTH